MSDPVEDFVRRVYRLEERYRRDKFATHYLVPARECKSVRDWIQEMAKNWWFKFEFNKWRTDSMLRRCSLETRGFWLECICVMREMGTDRLSGRLEDIARMVGCFPAEAERCIAELHRTGTADSVTCNAHVTQSNGEVTLVSRYISREVKTKAQTKLRVRRHRSNASVTPTVTTQSKSNKKEEEEETPKVVSSSEEFLGNENHKLGNVVVPHTGENGSLEKPPPKEKKSRGSRLPDGFIVSDEMLNWGRDQRPDLDIEKVAKLFCNYYRSAPGQKGVRVDWRLTWENWVMREKGERHAADYRESRRREAIESHNRAEEIRRRLDATE